jgi:hypothetical protein
VEVSREMGILMRLFSRVFPKDAFWVHVNFFHSTPLQNPTKLSPNKKTFAKKKIHAFQMHIPTINSIKIKIPNLLQTVTKFMRIKKKPTEK